MTSNEPGDGPNPGDPAEDATQADWSVGAPQGLPPAQSLPPSAMPPAGEPPAGPPPGPASGAPAGPPSAPAPGYVPPPGYAPAPAPGYAPGYAPATAPGMAWAPPPEVLAGPGAGGLEYASAGARFAAWLVDRLILFIVGAVIGLIAFALIAGTVDWTEVINSRAGLRRTDFGPFLAASVAASLVGLAIELLYFVFLWTSRSRATLGMRLLNLQVANAADGATLTRGQAVRRWVGLGALLGLLQYVPIIAAFAGLIQLLWAVILLGTVATSPTKQGLHDRFAGSVIVNPRGGSSNAFLIGCLALVGFVVLGIVVGFLALIFLGSQVSDILRDYGNSI